MPRSKQAPLDCKQAARQATEFLEGRLAAPLRAQYVRHLETCGACSTYAQQIALVRGALHKLPGPRMDAADLAKLQARLKTRRSD